MTWFTWRQSRTEMFIFAAAIAAVAIFLIWTGLDVRSQYDSLGIASCLSSSDTSGTCQEALGNFSDRVEGVRNLANWLVLFPLLAGVLVAAPVVIDLEQGTYRLAWTQGVTRTRWLATKIALGVAILTAVSLIMMALWKWWGKPFVHSSNDRVGTNQWDSVIFDSRAVLVSYAIFAFALCLAVGTVFRRSIAAFGVSLVGFIGIRVLIENHYRPHYLAPHKYIGSPIDNFPANVTGGWHVNDYPSDQYGYALSWNDPAVQQCFGMKALLKGAQDVVPAPSDIDAAIAAQRQCFIDHNFYMTTVYQPANRFWIFQGIEMAIFLGLATILLGFTFYWVTRRIAR
jgi:hypothetical protein